MFEDSAGYLEADPVWLKGNIFPVRHDLSVNDVRILAVEIIQSEAWMPFRAIDSGKLWVWDPKFEEHQRRRDKMKEAPSKFAERNEKGENIKFHIGLEPIPLENVEREWSTPKSPRIKSEPQPSPPKKEAPKSLSLKKILEDDPEMNDLVNTLRGGKFPEAGSFLGKCLKEIKGIKAEELKLTLQIVLEKDEFEGSVFAYAWETARNISNENVTKRVEDQAKEFKEDEARGPEQVGDIITRLSKGE